MASIGAAAGLSTATGVGATPNDLLLENGNHFLLESGSGHLLLEAAGPGVGASAGSGLAAAVGYTFHHGQGAAAGVGTATGVSLVQGIISAVGSAAGHGTASTSSVLPGDLLVENGDHFELEDGTGHILIETPNPAIVNAVGVSVGAALATAIANTIHHGRGTVSATGTATGISNAVGGITAAVGFSSGHGTAVGAGQATGTIAAVGLATGAGAATAGVGTSTRAGTGTAFGNGAAVGFPQSSSTNEGHLDFIRLEFSLPGIGFTAAGFTSTAFGGGGWTSVMGDTRATDPIVLDYGAAGNSPDDVIGATGTLSFTLNNAADNTAGILSYYSPLHVNHRAGTALNIQVRLVFGINGQSYYKFLGRLAETNPEPGRHGTYRVPCLAVDLMDDWAANDVPTVIPVLQGLNTASLMDYLLTTVGATTPDLGANSRSLETGVEAIPYAFHDPARRKIREMLIDIVMSEYGFASFRGGPNPEASGNFAFFNRHAASTYPISASLINQFSVDGGFQATQSRDALASTIEVFVYPSIVDTALVDIFKLAGSPLLVLPFQTTIVHLPFKTDERPDTPVSAVELRDIEPHVDFTVNTLENGQGDDITDNFVMEHLASSGGFEAVVSITNRGAILGTLLLAQGAPAYQPVNVPPGYVTLLKGRGRGLYITEASAKVTLDSVYGRRPLQIVMPWLGNVNTATDIANFFGNIYRNQFAQIDSVKFCANKTQTLMEAAIFLEPGAIVYIQEDVTGIAGTFRIQGVHLEINSNVLWCTWRLLNVDRQKFWLLGTANRSELGLTTILGF